MYPPNPSLPRHAVHSIRKNLTLCAISLVWLWVTAPSSAASFPCEKAGTKVERAVCADPELSSLDETLGRYYAAARAGLQHATTCLAADQKAWLREVRDVCKSAACLKSAYLQRLGVLDGMQPGATALTAVQLPKVPTLVAILPPAQDQAALPRGPNLKRQSIQGRLANEVSTGDGFVIVTKAGTKRVLAALMFLDDSTSSLDALSQDASAEYLVRGYTEPGPDAGGAFAQGACRYIYRVPM